MEGGIFRALLSDPKICGLLDDSAFVASMVEVERALAVVQGRLGVIDAAAATAIDRAIAGFAPDLADLACGTAKAGVPVPALVAQLRRTVGEPAASWLHWGATSQDIVDTALVLRLRMVLEVLSDRIDELSDTLAVMAEAHRTTVTVARTRFQQALPTSFGLKVAGWLAPLLRHRDRLEELRPRLLSVQFGGAAGNLAALGPRGVEVMAGLADELELGCPPMPWHSQRDGIAELAGWLALVTGSLGKFGLDLLLLAQNEIGEVREAEGGGSSTMPQKANPVRCEALVTLARRNAVQVAAVHEAMLHAQERDGSAWQAEWLALPEMLVATGAALGHAVALARSAVIDVDRMARLLAATRGVLLAEAASFALAGHLPRAQAQELVKLAAQEATATGLDLLELLRERSTSPIDWDGLRRAASHPPCADELIDRVVRIQRREGS
jgi:3-carboxy-cis,cis-muconate cycloisomerase